MPQLSLDNSVTSGDGIVLFANRVLGQDILQDLLGRLTLRLDLLVVHDSETRDLDLRIVPDHLAWLSWNEFLHEWMPAKGAIESFSAGLCVQFGHKLPPQVLGLFRRGVINLHPSLLPFGRGKHPATWAIWDQTPYGATLHLIDDSLDGGPVIAQREIPISPCDTSMSLYSKGLRALHSLYEESAIPWLTGYDLPMTSQIGEGSYHSGADLDSLTKLPMNELMTTERVIRWLRARTVGQDSGAIFSSDQRQYVITVSVTPLPDERGNSK